MGVANRLCSALLMHLVGFNSQHPHHSPTAMRAYSGAEDYSRVIKCVVCSLGWIIACHKRIVHHFMVMCSSGHKSVVLKTIVMKVPWVRILPLPPIWRYGIKVFQYPAKVSNRKVVQVRFLLSPPTSSKMQTSATNHKRKEKLVLCSTSSIGGTLPCQGRGYGFKPRVLLHMHQWRNR